MGVNAATKICAISVTLLAMISLFIRLGDAARAQAVIQTWTASGSETLGTIELSEDAGSGTLKITGDLNGLTPGKHGFHIHALSNLVEGCGGAAGHFNPESVNHGSPVGRTRHHGDLGNIEANSQGIARIDISDRIASLYGDNSVVGRSFVVHAGEDDLGRGGDEGSLKTGNAGGRVGCGVIGITSTEFSPLSGECTDLDSRKGYCSGWRKQGLCRMSAANRYLKYMQDNCRRTCGMCSR